MRKSIITAVAALGLGVGLFAVAPQSRAADEKEIKGVLIDQHCAEKFTSKKNPEKAAMKHTKECAVKCADSGYEVITGKEEKKFDDASNAKAKEYFEKHDSTKVTIKATEKDGKLSVSSIEPQEEEKK
jgi:hypothetical protein